MMPFTMMPVGPIGDRDAEFAPLATMMAIRNAGIPVWAATVIAIGPISAADAMLPGPMEPNTHARKKNMTGMSGRLPRHDRTARCATLVECAVHFRLREQQRHPDEREEQPGGKAGGDLG